MCVYNRKGHRTLREFRCSDFPCRDPLTQTSCVLPALSELSRLAENIRNACSYG